MHESDITKPFINVICAAQGLEKSHYQVVTLYETQLAVYLVGVISVLINENNIFRKVLLTAI